MTFHRNAKLGLAGRYALVCAIARGMSLKAAAAGFSVSPATAHRWWHRWLQADEEARRTLSCLFDRSSRPQRSPRQLAPQLEQAICTCRRETGWGPRLVAGCTTNPDGGWVTQQARQLVWGLAERPTPVRFLIRDRDRKFAHHFDAVLRSEGIEILRTPVRAPKANAVAERFVRTVRAECLDWLLILNRRHLERVLQIFLDREEAIPRRGPRRSYVSLRRPTTVSPHRARPPQRWSCSAADVDV